MSTTHKVLKVLRAKVALVGDQAVGKTALLKVAIKGSQAYPKNYVPSTFADFSVKSVDIPETDTQVELLMYDIPGQSTFVAPEDVAPLFKSVSLVAVVFDIVSRESFNSCKRWLDCVAAQKPGRQIEGVLIGTRVELRETGRPAVSFEEGNGFAEAHGLKYFETSAADDSKVNEPFNCLGDIFAQKYDMATKEINSLL
eukprot:TRINITY_DN6989_c0_g2_i1.p1 TRINITY_DN6989_c0_g2~~TRINITY_DN6989_c0_g2_i1.p1  ORF type:complete len:198 (-),score=50.19 TRINITY_DN6989_c0_g2_i1:239-832(-)